MKTYLFIHLCLWLIALYTETMGERLRYDLKKDEFYFEGHKVNWYAASLFLGMVSYTVILMLEVYNV